ncbi:hypothetical protein D3C87_1850640 [compost metagenome]
MLVILLRQRMSHGVVGAQDVIVQSDDDLLAPARLAFKVPVEDKFEVRLDGGKLLRIGGI